MLKPVKLWSFQWIPTWRKMSVDIVGMILVGVLLKRL
jgi:hypothetical protein